MPLNLRYALMEDWPGISEVSRKSGYEDYINRIGPEYLKSGEVILAEYQSKVVGFMKIQFTADNSSWYSGIRVDPDFRRISVATSLTEMAFAICRARKTQMVRLMIHDSNIASIGLAKKLGFEAVSRFAFFDGIPENFKTVEERPAGMKNPRFLNMGWIFIPYSSKSEDDLRLISFGKKGLGYMIDKNSVQIVEGDNSIGLSGEGYSCMEISGNLPDYLEKFRDKDFDFASVYEKSL